MKKKTEKRTMERFHLELPTELSVIGKDGEQKLHELWTNNICAGGAFFETNRSLPVGTVLKMDLVLSLVELKKLEGKKTHIKISGVVIRSYPEGMAVRFQDKYQIYESITPNNQENELIPDLIPETSVHILGSNKLLNELLASYMETKAGLKSAFYSKLSLVHIVNNEPDLTHLVLVDCLDTNLAQLRPRLGIEAIPNQAKYYIALFNVDPGRKLEREAMNKGIRGIFYNNEPLKIFLKGVLAILKGELWYSRDTISKYLLEPRSPNKLSAKMVAALTFREKEILTRIASGMSNQDMSDDLCISPHTVKTHIYNIYKKINVSNRLQATLWAAEYL
jgi:DNA-binding NarL/FixJ family response regulator